MNTTTKTIVLVLLILVIVANLVTYFAYTYGHSTNKIRLTPTSDYASAANLAPIPSNWSVYDVRPDPGNVNNNLDYGVLGPNGEPSVRSDSVLGGATYHGYRASIYNPAREIDSVWYSVRPGDHIVFSVWMKTGPSGGQDPNNPQTGYPDNNYVAACLGWDWYGSNGRIGANIIYNGREYIPYGIGWSTDWTFRQYDLIVPATADDGTGNFIPINGLILWLGADMNDSGQVWFADPEFCIIP